MSYDIGLYQPAFLKRATNEDLDDWTDADPIPKQSLATIRAWLQSKGYAIEHEQVGCCEWIHQNSAWGLQVSVFSGEVAFTIPYWPESDAAIEEARKHARELAALVGLGFLDRQTGELEI